MKVLIADDELLICEWLEFCIAQNPSWQLVGRARNGREALRLYMAHKPELVFTDIKMPVMDGIELLRAIREDSAEANVVLLTAFSEFELARDALRYGATEYILKTEASQEVFTSLLERMAQKLANSHQGETEDGTDWQRQTMAKNLLAGKTRLTPADIALLNEKGIRWRADGLFAIALWKHRLHKNFTFPPDDNVRHLLGFEYNENTFVAIGNLPQGMGGLARNNALCAYLEKLTGANGCMVGVSGIGDVLETLPLLPAQAVAALSEGFYTGTHRIYRWQSSDTPGEKTKDWQREMKRLYQEFHLAPGKEKWAVVEKALGYAEQNRVYPVELLLEFCDAVMEDACPRIEGGPDETLFTARQAFRAAPFYAEKRALLASFLKEHLWQPGYASESLSPGVARAVEYVRQNFAGAISLEQTAEEANLNPEYLSRIFKEEVGCTFTAFLTDIRMKKASSLLRSTSMKVNQIGQQVGYPNVSYFSTLFKKTYGLNPFEYRRQNHNS